MFQYFKFSLSASVLGLMASFAVGFYYSQTWQGAFTACFLTAALSLLEISLSFDNAVVNASVLGKMTLPWQRRFMTYGMLIAVFGMRLVFPLMVVSLFAWLNPWQALVLAVTRPDEYAKIMLSSQTSLVGFGASFLLLVSLSYFIDKEKDVHWLRAIERPLKFADRFKAAELVFCGGLFYLIGQFLPNGQSAFLWSAGCGIAGFVLLDSVMRLLKPPKDQSYNAAKASFTLFLYLEVLDASFSLDGVIGAFAVTNNLLILAIGLGIGALFVRSLTLLLLEKKTLQEFRYLEHGAFYAIGALAFIMLISLFTPVPEVITGLIGVAIIALSLLSSHRHGKAEAR